MESGDTSNEEAPPCDPKSNNPMQKEWSKVISMVVDMETEHGLKRCAVMVIVKKIQLACADLLYHIDVKIFSSVMYSCGFNLQRVIAGEIYRILYSKKLTYLIYNPI